MKFSKLNLDLKVIFSLQNKTQKISQVFHIRPEKRPQVHRKTRKKIFMKKREKNLEKF